MGYHSIIYIFLFLPVCLFVYQLAPEKWRGRVLLGIQLDFLLSAKWEITGLSFRNNASDPLYWHLADCDPDAEEAKAVEGHGTETKESS